MTNAHYDFFAVHVRYIMCVCVFVLASRWEFQFNWYLRKSGSGPYQKNDLVLVTFSDEKKGLDNVYLFPGIICPSFQD